MTPRPTLRVLSAGDTGLFRSMLALFAVAFESEEHYMSKQPSDEYINNLLSDENFVAIIAQSESQTVGGLAGYVLRKFEQARSEFYIYDLAVAESHRRRGIATALIEEVKAICAQRGIYVIFVQADYGDDPAIALYTKLGTREDVMHFDIQPDGGAGQ
jgi:aminoglycoside 3-N-acetyltransferase I